MLQYLVILLDDTSIAYCHSSNPIKTKRLINKDVLRKAILYGMKNNLMIQYVLPSYELPQEYCDIIECVDNVKIGKDIQIYDYIPDVVNNGTVVLRIRIKDFINNTKKISSLIKQVTRLTISYINIEEFYDELIPSYTNALDSIHEVLLSEMNNGKKPQLNILTDRLTKQQMTNCGAGVDNITVAPNGKFYICPAFYFDERMGVDTNMNHKECIVDRSVGDLNKGLNIKNKNLLALDFSPLCKLCDSYHCNRCVWLNQKLTFEINTPSRQQCIISHIERNSSMRLSKKMLNIGIEVEQIGEIDYLDPYDNFFK